MSNNHIQYSFQRFEKKYLVTSDLRDEIVDYIKPYMKPDKYDKYTLCNLYYDTDTYDLIRRSIEKPVYKEKIRLRSYGIPKDNDNVFIEIKKKYKGIVYKRRICVPYTDAVKYLDEKKQLNLNDQIYNEINYSINYYKPNSKVFLAYDRCAYFSIDDPNLRLTFDCNIRGRDYDLKIQDGDYGEKIIDDDQCLMELKISEAMPIWLARMLSEFRIYPISFSKYGNVYTKILFDETHQELQNIENSKVNMEEKICYPV